MSCKRSSSTSSLSAAAEIIEGNEDLLNEILVLLPAKSLVKFKVVNKRWRSLISAPLFWRRHLRRQTQPSFILSNSGTKYLICNPRGPSQLPCNFGFSRFKLVKVLQSCNGLLLLKCGGTTNGRICYFVFNPTTLQRQDLKPIPRGRRGYPAIIYLMFDPSLLPHYRVVCFVEDRVINDIYKIYLYSSETHRWKLRNDQRIEGRMSLDNGIYFNGGIFFLQFQDHSSSLFIRDSVVSNIPNPRPLHPSPKERRNNYARESNGVLFWLSCYWGNGSDVLQVCEMEKIENGWSEKYRVDMKPIMETCGWRCCSSIDVMGMFRGEKEQDSYLLLSSFYGKQIVIYRFGDGVCEVVVDYTTTSLKFQNDEKQKLDWYVRYAHHFIQSIAPV